MSITIKDIAKMAGVTHATVSRSLNNSSLVSEKTKERIIALAKQLNYSPHSSARALILGKTHNIGLFILYDIFQQEFPADFLQAILAGMAEQLNGSNYKLVLLFDQIQDKKDQVPLGIISENNLDGVFVLGLENDAGLAYKLAHIDLPLVLVNQKPDGLKLPFVATDDELGGYMATSHLLDLGHRRIAFIEGDPRYAPSQERKKGYHRALLENGIDLDYSMEKLGHYNQSGGYAALRQLMADKKDLTAVFASNDNMALGALNFLSENNIRVPQDISIVGFDDAQFAAYVTPKLTTIKKPRTLMGSTAAGMMLKLLANDQVEPIGNVVLAPSLIIRESTRPL